MSGPFKMKGFSGFGNSPAKQHKKYSQRIGPAQDPKKIREALYTDYPKHQKMKEYTKYYPKDALGEGETDARAYLD